MRLQYLQRVQLSIKPSSAVMLGAIVTVGAVVLIMYWHSHSPTVADGAERYLWKRGP